MNILLDACTLILLAKINLLRDVLRNNSAGITETVHGESQARRSDDAFMIEKVIQEKIIQIYPDPSNPMTTQFMKDFRLGKGEATGILVAKKRKAIFATDDGLAIRACKICGVPFLTAVHFILQTHKKGGLDTEQALVKLKILSAVGRYQSAIIQDAEKRLKNEGGN